MKEGMSRDDWRKLLSTRKKRNHMFKKKRAHVGLRIKL